MDYINAESFVLPSLGKVYSTPINPNVKLRSMTTSDELKRLSPSEHQYQNICEIIDDCMVDKCEISSYDMCLADYQFLLHKLRIVTYGTEYKARTKCPYCGTTNERTIDLDKLEVIQYSKDFDKYYSFELPKTKKNIRLRIQTPRMIDIANQEWKEIKQKYPDTKDESFIISMASMIESIDGKNVDVLKRRDWLRTLPMMDTNYIVQYAGKLNDTLGIVSEMNTTCSYCGLDYRSPFRYGQEFFGPRIDI